MSAPASLSPLKTFNEVGPLKIVHQQDMDGCAVGALATLLGVSYEVGKQAILAHRCSYAKCRKCKPANGEFPVANYRACAGHVVDILEFNGFKAVQTTDIYKQKVYPVLVKVQWGPTRNYGSHFVIWDARLGHYLCPSRGIRPAHDKSHMDRCFRWADEPAYIMKHPKYLPVTVKVKAA